jgi:hypothetical protein
MGWSYGYDNKCAKDVHKEILTGFAPGYKVLASASKAYGKRFWVKLETPTGERFIYLALVNGDKNNGWGYKGMDESMGPNEVDCPLKFLKDLSPPQNEWSKNWREKVVNYWEARKGNHGKKFSSGDRVLIGGTVYVVTGKSARSYFVTKEGGNGLIYRSGPMKMHLIHDSVPEDSFGDKEYSEVMAEMDGEQDGDGMFEGAE